MTYYVTVTRAVDRARCSHSARSPVPSGRPLEVVARAADDGLRRHRMARWPRWPRRAAAAAGRSTRGPGRDGRPGSRRGVGDHLHRLSSTRTPSVRAASVDELRGACRGRGRPSARPCLRAFLGERADDAPLERAAGPGGRRACWRRRVGLAGSGVVDRHRAARRLPRVARHRAAPGAHRWTRHRGHLGRRQHLVHRRARRRPGSDRSRPWLRYVQVKDGTGRLPDWQLTRIGAR